jgi:hypothetical protein
MRYNRTTQVMMFARSTGFAFLFALCATSAPARVVYKCTTAQGGITYQDKACESADAEALLHVSDDASAAAPAPAEPAPAADPAPNAVMPEQHHPRTALPPLWLCMNAEDGSVYGSRFGPTPPRLVPLGVLGFPRKSLAQAFAAGSNVMSAPELNKPPIDRSPESSAAASYTQLQDECVVANADQTCTWLRRQFDVTSEKLDHARFKDERAKLQSEFDGLQEDLGGC